MNPVDQTKKIISLTDFTLLNENASEAAVVDLCQKSMTPFGPVAAICVYPPFVPLVRAALPDSKIKITTVANFPEGKNALENVVAEIKKAVKSGVDEIDVVTPYHLYLEKKSSLVPDFLHACRDACPTAITLKIILETGALQDPVLITQASFDAINASADFIKTSTGKISTGATLEAAHIMLSMIKSSERRTGFKASGGIRTMDQALTYLEAAETILGKYWISPERFRFGMSQLIVSS